MRFNFQSVSAPFLHLSFQYIYMNMKLSNSQLCIAFLVGLFAVSCAGSVQEVVNPAQAPVKINKIVIVPFYSDPDYSEEESEETRVAKEQFLTDALYDELVSREKGLDIVPLETAKSEIKRVETENPGITYKDTFLKVGKNLNADAVLTGSISDYTQREGGEFGVTSPASVVFDVQLYNPVNGQLIWEAYFVEAQKTLLENVVEVRKFIKRRGKWVKADELAKEGVVEIVDKLDEFLKSNVATN